MPALFGNIRTAITDKLKRRKSTPGLAGDPGLQGGDDLEAQDMQHQDATTGGARRQSFFQGARKSMVYNFEHSAIGGGMMHMMEFAADNVGFHHTASRSRRGGKLRHGANAKRNRALNQLKDAEERSRVAKLRAKMRHATGRKEKSVEEEESLAMGLMKKTQEQSTEQKNKNEDSKAAEDAPEEGEISDIIGDLGLTVEPSVEMLGDPVLIEQRKAGTINVRSEATILAFKKHKAITGKMIFEAENGCNLACELFNIGDIDGALMFFQRSLEIVSADRKPALKEVADFKHYLHHNFGGDDSKFYAELSAGEWRSALGRGHFIESLKKLDYTGNAERLFSMLDNVSGDGKVSLQEVQVLMKMKHGRLAEMDYDIMEKGVLLNNIAACMIQQGDYLAALTNLREALGILDKVSFEGMADHRIHRVMGNIAVAYIRLEDYDTALDNLSQLLELRERRWGRTHSEVLIVLFHIGYCFLAKASHYKIFGDCSRMDGRSYEKPVEFNYNLALCAYKERLLRQQEVFDAKQEEIDEVNDNVQPGQPAPVIDMGEIDQLRLDIARSQEIVAEIHEKQGQSYKAVEFFREAVANREAVLADTDPELLTSWNQLAACNLKTGALEEALTIMERATHASEMLFGDVSSTVATMLWHTGLVLFKLGASQQWDGSPDYVAKGSFELAEEKLEHALSFQREICGEDSLAVASTVQLMGSVSLAKGDRITARKRLEDALLKRLALAGRTAVVTASSAHALGALYARTPRRNEEAIQLLRKAVLIREKRLGENSLYLAESLHEQGCALLRRKTKEDADEALILLSTAAKIREKRLGKNCAIYATSMHQTGMAHIQLGLYAEARLYLQAAVELREKLVGRKTAQTASSYHGLGMAFYHMGSYRKAMKYLKAAYSVRERIFTIDHALSADSLHEIGMVYVRKKEFTACLPFLKKALDVRIELNKEDVKLLEDDSDEDEKNVYRGESERQRRIRHTRDNKRRHDEKEKRKHEREAIAAEKQKQKEAARMEAIRKKKALAKQKKAEAAARRKAAGPGKLAKLVSKIRGKELTEAEKKDSEEESLSSSSSDEGKKDASVKKTETGWASMGISGALFTGQAEGEDGQKVNLSDSEDEEIDISEVGIDVRGWLAGTIGYDMYIISNVYADMRDYSQAKHYLDRAICLQEEVFGSASVEYGEVLHAYGVLHVKQDERVKALGYFLKALAVRERICGHNNEDTAQTEIELGETLAHLNQPDEALIHLSRGCNIRETLFGIDDLVSMHLREKWAGLSAGATFYDPVPEGETLPHFARRSPESFLHGYMDRAAQEAEKEKEKKKIDKEKAEEAAEAEQDSSKALEDGSQAGTKSETGTKSEAEQTATDEEKSEVTSNTGSQGTRSTRQSQRKSVASTGSGRKSVAPGSDGIAASGGSGALKASRSNLNPEDVAASAGSGGLPAAGALASSMGSKGLRVSIDEEAEVTEVADVADVAESSGSKGLRDAAQSDDSIARSVTVSEPK